MYAEGDASEALLELRCFDTADPVGDNSTVGDG